MAQQELQNLNNAGRQIDNELRKGMQDRQFVERELTNMHQEVKRLDDCAARRISDEREVDARIS